MQNIARWTMAHRRIVVVGWIIAVVGILGVSGSVGKKTASDFTLPGTGTQHAVDLLRSRFSAQAARSGRLQVELGGQAVEQAQQASLGFATVVGIAAAIIILLLSFGSFSAMGLPIATALFGLGAGVGVITLASQVIDMPDFAS